MFNKKTWKDRISQYPNRRTINDGIISKNVTVSRNEGTVTEAGDSFNAANMNDLEDRINEAFTNIVHMPRINNKAPYQYRQTPVKADRCIEKLIGCSCAFNQLANSYRADASYAGITLTNYSDYVHLQGITTAEDNITILNVSSGIIPSGHKFLAWLYGINSNDCKIVCGSPIMSSNYGSFAIIGSSTALSMSLALGFKSGVSIDNDVRVNCIDLTALFGSSEVADYFYNLETQTAGAGVAKFRQLFPESYYAYQTATLMSAKPVDKKVVGINQWDEQTEDGYISSTGEPASYVNAIRSKNFCECLPNTTYYYKKHPDMTGFSVCWYDSNQNFIVRISDSYIVTSPSNARYFKLSLYNYKLYSSTYNHDVSINYPSTDTDYHAYEEHTYSLGSDEIRGVFKIENGELVAYGDVHNSDGTGVKYFEERAYASGDENLPNAITDGTKTVVALATPVSTTYTAFSNPMICGSTEEFTDSRSVKMPCGHDSLYEKDLIVPNTPTVDGTYTLKCTVVSGEPTLNWQADT